MHQFSVSIVNESGSRKTPEALADEICNTFYLYSSNDGRNINAQEYKESKAQFLNFAEHLLSKIDHDADPMIMIGMQQMDDDE